MCQKKDFLALAFYKLFTIENPRQLIKDFKSFCSGKEIVGRVYISEQGINGQMSARKGDADAFMGWLRSQEGFAGLDFKPEPQERNIFERLTVKYRQELVAIGEEIDFSKQATHLSPEEWKQVIEEDDDYVILDVRNDYEWDVGHFEGAINPGCETFRSYDSLLENLKEKEITDKTKILMCCTGGIRCEVFSPLLKKKGFENLYQLQGGIIAYGQKVGNKHWKGDLFVFDDRMTTPISEEKSEPIAKCHRCAETSSHYFNCANMDCNKLFICCPSCLKELRGCCQESCVEAPRVRPFHEQNPHKPFRRWHHYAENKEDLTTEKMGS